jgi:hypothetical protein
MLLTVLGVLQIIGPDAVPREPWMTELIGVHNEKKDWLGPGPG